MTQLVTAQTGTPMPQDPAISLKFLLQTSDLTDPIGQWGSTGANPSLPAAAAVNVDTKWGPSGMHNKILIENMPRLTEYQQLGGARIRTTDVKRVQVWCDTLNAVTNKWLIEEEIRRLIMANKLGFKAVGIDEVLLMQGFQDIDVSGMDGDADQVQRGGYLARSYCLVKMIYDEISQ